MGKVVLLHLPRLRTSITEGIRPAAQSLLVEYAHNVGPPPFGTQPTRDDDPLTPKTTFTPMKQLSRRSIFQRVEGRRIVGLWYGVNDGYLRLELDDGSALVLVAPGQLAVGSPNSSMIFRCKYQDM